MKIAITEKELNKKKVHHAENEKSDPQKFKKDVAKAYTAHVKTKEGITKFVKPSDISSFMKQDVNEWGRYPLSQLKGIPREQFQSYCCGWLQYYDEITRNRATDHIIWFDWKDTKVWKDQKGGCRVYIYPAPRRKGAKGSSTASFSSDPTNPTAPPPPY